MKPADFFFGAMDFFAILLPGAVLAYLLTPWSAAVFGPVLPPLDSEAKQWVAFAICSYFFGHLLHQIGSVLDDEYDRGYKARRNQFGEHRLLVETRRLVEAEFGQVVKDHSMFYWAGSYVRANNQAAGAELERSGADSKFFRSLCLLSMLAIVLFLVQSEVLAALFASALAAFSFQRFCSRRWDNSVRTYEYFVQIKTREQSQRGGSDGGRLKRSDTQPSTV
jgi:hypothetical protein